MIEMIILGHVFFYFDFTARKEDPLRARQPQISHPNMA